MKRHGSMNHIYRVVWSEARQAWIAVAEITRGRGKASRRRLVAAVLSLSATAAVAEPLGGQVTAGAGSIAQSGATTTVTQSSQNLSVNWQSFNVGAAETVNFVQPSAAAIAVNRILDPNGTQVMGRVNANGQVYLINPNGILFGRNAQVNVGGLVASTLQVSDVDGETRAFSGTGQGSVVNKGTIDAASGGYVALLGNNVSNEGVISAHLGSAALGAGSAATLTFSGNSLVRMQVDQSVFNSVASNGGLIRADGGAVLMSAGANDALLASVVNNTGVIEARTVENRDGTIVLLAGMSAGTVNVGGTVDASAPSGGNGGFVETSAAQLNVASGTKVTTAASMGLAGTWLIDPVDFTVAASGGNITGADLSASLGGGDVEIQSSGGTVGTAGDVNVNDVVTWNVQQLTLSAYNDININAQMNGSGTAVLALEYGQGAVAAGNLSEVVVRAPVNLPAGPTFSTVQGSDGVIKNFTVITGLGVEGSITATDLQGMNGNHAANYALGGNIEALATAAWNGGTGFVPVGVTADPFTGTFDGLGHYISDLTIDTPSTFDVGLFGATSGADLQNVGLINSSITGAGYVGALVGSKIAGNITNTYSTGTVNGGAFIGGLVGKSDGGSFTNTHSTATVSGGSLGVGGLVGEALAPGTITNSYATGAVTAGLEFSGGLVGYSSIDIANSYATGALAGDDYAGGLVGYLNAATVDASYSVGSVSGATTGGLVGRVGGGGTVTNSFWNTETSGQATSAGGGTGRTTAQMRTTADLASGLTFTTTPGATGNNWVIVDDDGTLNNFGDAAGATYPMLASEYSTNISNAHELQLMTMTLAGTFTLSADVDAATTATNTDVWTSAGFVPVGNLATDFSGTFDGLGRSIGSLFIDRPAMDFVGLFGVANAAAQVRNVSLNNADVTGNEQVGALIGRNLGTVHDGHAAGTVNGLRFVGGLIGRDDHGVIHDSSSAAIVAASFGIVGGLVGQARYSTIDDSHASGAISGGSSVGGLAGSQIHGTLDDSSATGVVAGTGDDVGGLVGYSEFGTIQNGTAGGAVSGAARVGGLVGENYLGSISTSTATGNVTATSEAGGLVGSTYGSITDSHATGDVTGGFATGGLVGIATYGAVISGSDASGDVSGTSSVGGLIGTQEDGSLSNSNASGAVVGTGNDVGGLVGDTEDSPIDSSSAIGTVSGVDNVGGLVGNSYYSDITNSHASGNVTAASYVGGLVGNTYGSVSNSYATGSVTGSGYSVGGLIGGAFEDGTISDTYALGDVSGTHAIGGLIGAQEEGSVLNSTASGAVAGTGDDVGGLVGHTEDSSIDNSSASGSVSGNEAVGGLVGNSYYTTINNSTASGNVSGLAYVGGIVGNTYGSVSNSHATGTVTGTDRIGGLVGYVSEEAIISDSDATGIVTGSTRVGGLIGLNADGAVIDSFASGSVSGDSYVGGLVGYNDNGTTISASNSTGAVSATSDYVGGLVGFNNYGTLTTSFATSDVTGSSSYVGGLVGYNSYGSISDSHATGIVVGTGGSIGGLVGLNKGATSLNAAFGAISNSYATGNVSGSGATGGLVGFNFGGTIDSSHAEIGTVAGNTQVGGLVGRNTRFSGSAAISNSYASGAVTGSNYVGGLAGSNNYGAISNSFASGSVTASRYSGGMVGSNYGGTITGSHASGAVNGTDQVGGLAGINQYGSTITTSYATGDIVASGSDAGGLAGKSDDSTIEDSYATGNVNAAGVAGGLVGNAEDGNIARSYATGNVTASGGYGGGLVARNNYGVISDSHATGDVLSGGSEVGGLVGYNYGSITTSYATGQVTGVGNYVGGLVGDHLTGATISLSYATGNVSGAGDVGGLVGYAYYGGVSNSYATGDVTGNSNVGGLVGHQYDASIDNSYASGPATGTSNVGGLVGFHESGVISDSFWGNTLNQVGVNGVTTGATGMSTLQMQTGANYTSATLANGNVDPAWDFANTWILYEGHTTPLLRYYMTPITATAGSVVKTYDGVAFTGGNGVTFSVVPDGNLLGAGAFTGSSQGSRNAGSYVIASDAYSHQQGYAITFVDGTLTVNPAALAVSTSNVTKIYDGGLAAAGTAVVAGGALVGGDTLSGTGTFAFTDKNVGSGNKTVTTTAATINDGNNGGNYAVTFVDNTTSTITAASLAVTGVTAIATKVYDGTATAALGGTAAVSGIGSEDVAIGSTGSGMFANRNAGSGKAITVTGFTLTGADAGNYTIAQPTGLTADITAANLMLSSNNVTKVYDGGLGAAGSPSVAGGTLFAGDTLSGGSFAFTSKNVGSGNRIVTAAAVTVNDGNSGGNYNVSYANNTTSTITAANLAVTGVTAGNKVFDGTTAVILGGTAVVNALGADVVSLGGIGSGVFDDENIGAHVGVTVTGFTLGGADADNYALAQPIGLTANIMPEALPQTLSAGIAQLESDVLRSDESAPDRPSLALIATEESQACSTVGVAATDTAASGSGDCAVVSIGGASGPRLRVINGGMRLPDTMVKVVNE